ncbi:MAG: N-methyltryptophan oxidase [Hyphobacterium sp.]|nr:MAG: N-methyltryptophan oxidase [Hyphobacterium sp.]
MRDIGIIGLGAMGLACANAARAAGASVIGFEQFSLGHSSGSSHGETRMIRRIYSEGAAFMPLLDRSFDLWAKLESASGEPLMQTTGGLDIGPTDSAFMREARASAGQSGHRHVAMDAATANDVWPALQLPDNFSVLHAPESAVLQSDMANAVMARLAIADGAELHDECPVVSVETTGDHFLIQTATDTHAVRRVINAAGPWGSRFSTEMDAALTIERQVACYFDGPPDEVPPFQRVLEDGRRIYTQPAADPGRWKLGLYGHRGQTGPEYRNTSEVDDEDRRILTDCVKAVLPDCPPPDRFEICRFTNTNDAHFIIDRAPEKPGMVNVAACSGHGYKFAPAVGEAAVALALDLPPLVDLTPFTLARQTKL